LKKYNELDYANAVARVRASAVKSTNHDDIAKNMQLIESLKIPFVLDIEHLKSDYHNAKVIIKATMGNIQNYQKYLFNNGNIKVSALEHAIENTDYKLLPITLSSAIISAINKYTSTKNARDIDTILDEQFTKDANAIIDKTPDELLKNILSLEVNLSLRNPESSHKQKLIKLMKLANRKVFGLAPIYYYCKN
jgi:hypothetical protein